ncbi:MAG: hypothetical protein NW703_07320 [Nitrospiraceae bacterium]
MAWALVLAWLGIAACAGPAVKSTEEYQPATAEQLVALVQMRAEATRSAKGLFRAQIKGPGLLLPARVEGAVYYRRPDAMRVRGFTPFGGELFELVVSRDLYRLSMPTEGRELKGHTARLGEAGKLGRPVQLSLWAVHGALGLTTVPADAHVLLYEEGDRYRMEVQSSGQAAGAIGSADLNGSARVDHQQPDADDANSHSRRLWFDRRTLLMVQEDRLLASGEVEAVMKFEDFRAVGDQVVQPVGGAGSAAPLLRPFKITLEDGRGRGSVRLTFHEIVPNVALQPDELGVI